ncbi:hypothetical protein C8Q79DRAFT_930531 [Trametes meyenii]|nr:hypothetical protein C8Q79DRAFT_930531 [Trametes meyenii]
MGPSGGRGGLFSLLAAPRAPNAAGGEQKGTEVASGRCGEAREGAGWASGGAVQTECLRKLSKWVGRQGLERVGVGRKLGTFFETVDDAAKRALGAWAPRAGDVHVYPNRRWPLLATVTDGAIFGFFQSCSWSPKHGAKYPKHRTWGRR